MMIRVSEISDARIFMKTDEQKKSGLSESFVIGIIAIVFLLVGYQTALFIHRAAVTKIAANRDTPDTIYVVQQLEMASELPCEEPSSVTVIAQQTERKYGSHTPRAEAVRRNLPYPTVETFTFDPNTVSVEDLCRLGFTIKQAESIDNYRRSGGVFRRKGDFAKSYVVSDSVFCRLEPYINIPLLDLNEADVAALDRLPGIGEWYAQKIVEYRDELHGYSFKEQLLDIYKFDKEKYDALSDLIVVREPYNYPLWTLSADSLCKHPYIRNMETARSIILYRDHNPEGLWSVENLCSAGIISKEDADRLGRCVRTPGV